MVVASILRTPMIEHHPEPLGADALHPYEDCARDYFLNLADVPFEVSYHDLLQPGFWRECVRALRPFDRVRVVGAAGEFDIDLTVRAVTAHGAVLSPRTWGPVGVDDDQQCETRTLQ